MVLSAVWSINFNYLEFKFDFNLTDIELYIHGDRAWRMEQSGNAL